jgi:hypothetical protein
MFTSVTHFLTEETMIDFRELVGEHSGDNMAEAVWETHTTYSLNGRVRHNFLCDFLRFV